MVKLQVTLETKINNEKFLIEVFFNTSKTRSELLKTMLFNFQTNVLVVYKSVVLRYFTSLETFWCERVLKTFCRKK